MDALCHAKFVNHHCWFDALALIMQNGLLVCFLFNKYFTYLLTYLQIAVDQSPQIA